MERPDGSKVEREPRVYEDSLLDRDGVAVRVVESGLCPDGPHVRVFFEMALGGLPSTKESIGVHLSVEQARALRDALATFILDAEGDSPVVARASGPGGVGLGPMPVT